MNNFLSKKECKTIRRYRTLYEKEGLDRLLNDDWRGGERRQWVKKYEKLKQSKGKADPIYFVDGTHPAHNSHPSYG